MYKTSLLQRSPEIRANVDTPALGFFLEEVLATVWRFRFAIMRDLLAPRLPGRV
jgi:hypothetical protein